MRTLKSYLPAFIVAGIAVLAPVAMFLASILYFLLHKVNPLNASFWSWADYFAKDPADRLIQWKAMGIALFTTYFLIPLAVSTLFRKKISLHGEARFATANEIRQTPDLSGNKGIIVGKHADRILYFGGQQFVILAAPTRSGKGVGIVIPNCLTYEESLVVTDIKLENYRITAGYRKTVLGQEVYLFNPFAGEPADPDDPDSEPTPMCSHRWNPLDAIPQGVFRIGEIMSIGQIFWPSGGKDTFWNDGARNLFVGIVLLLCELRDQRRHEISKQGKSELPDYPVSFGEILRQANGRGSGKPDKAYFKSQLESYPWLSTQCRDALGAFAASTDDVAKSVSDTLKNPLGMWLNPIVDAATSTSDFKLTDVRKKRMTIYVGIPPKRLKDSARLINLFFSQLVSLNTAQLPEDNPKLKHVCLLLMDEFTAFGKIEIIASAVSYIAGYNLRLLPIIQSFSQLESVYGKEDARTFILNHALQIVYAPRDQKDANEVSESLGYFTLKNDSRSRSTSGKGGGSISTSDQRRALMLPQEVKELGKWKEIIFLENTKPILCEKIKYFEDPFFTERKRPPPPIPLLDVDQFLARQEKRLRDISNADVDFSELRLIEPPGASQLQLVEECGPIPTDYGDPIDEQALYGAVGTLAAAAGMPAEAIARVQQQIDAQIRARAEALERFENAPRAEIVLGTHGRSISNMDESNLFGDLPDDGIESIEADSTPLPEESSVPMEQNEIDCVLLANEASAPVDSVDPFADMASAFCNADDDSEQDQSAMEFL